MCYVGGFTLAVEMRRCIGEHCQLADQKINIFFASQILLLSDYASLCSLMFLFLLFSLGFICACRSIEVSVCSYSLRRTEVNFLSPLHSRN